MTLYSSYTNEELERWITASPRDVEAHAELLYRAAHLLRGSDDAVQTLRLELSTAEEEIERLEGRLTSEGEFAEAELERAKNELVEANHKLHHISNVLKGAECP